MYRTALAVSWACLIVGVAGCSSGTEESAPSAPATTPTVTQPPPPQTPPYELSQSGRQLIALVKTDDTDLLAAAFREISAKVLGDGIEGGYTVRIDCAYGNDPSKAANRLGTGKIAVGTLGAAQTGLAAGKTKVEFQPGRTCRENPAPTTVFDPARPLDRVYAIELCKGALEAKHYLADQTPVTLTEVTVQESAGRWTVTATAHGYAKPGTPSFVPAVVACVSSANPLTTEVTRFDLK